MRIDQISDNSTVYLDANIFLYHYEDISPDCSSLLEPTFRKIKFWIRNLLIFKDKFSRFLWTTFQLPVIKKLPNWLIFP